MEVRTELAAYCLSTHSGDDFATDNQSANIRALRLLDESLNQDVLVQSVESFDHRTGSRRRFREHDADPLRSLEELYDNRRPRDALDACGHMVGLAREYGRRQADVVAAEKLQRPEFVARAGDRLRAVKAIDAHHLELAHDRDAIKRDGCADAWNDGVDGADRFAAIEKLGAVAADADVELQRVEHADVVAVRARRLDERLGAEEVLV